jgi:hypothetical protein
MAFPLAFTTPNIANGFRVAGFLPMNKEIFPDGEFIAPNVTDMPVVENQVIASISANSKFSVSSRSASYVALSTLIYQVINIVPSEKNRPLKSNPESKKKS